MVGNEEKEEGNGSLIEELPTELIVLIVNFISDIKTYFNFSISCKQLFNICLDESVKQQKFLQLVQVRETNSLVFNTNTVSVLTNNIVWQIPNYSFPSLQQCEDKRKLCTITELIEMIDLKMIKASVMIYCYSSKYAPVEIIWLLWRYLENKLNKVEEGDKLSLLKFQNSVRNVVHLLIDWIQINPNYEWTRHPFHPSLLFSNPDYKYKNNDYGYNNDNNNNNNNNNDNNEGKGKEDDVVDIFTHGRLTREFHRFYELFLLKHNPIRRLSEELMGIFEEVSSSAYSPPHPITHLFSDHVYQYLPHNINNKNNDNDDDDDDPTNNNNNDGIVKQYSYYEEYRYHINLLDISSKEIIDMTTRIEVEMYKELCAFELHDINWSRDKRKHLSITVLKLMKYSNFQSDVYRNYLLSYESVEMLSIIYTKIIEMIDYAVNQAEVRNLNLAFYLYSTLRDSSVYRLGLERYISPLYAKKREELGELFDAHRTFARLRDKIREYQSAKIDYLPPISIFLTDIVFVYEGSPTYPPLSYDTISLVQWKMMGEILHQLFPPIQSSMKKIGNQRNIDENSPTFQFLSRLYRKYEEGNDNRAFAQSLSIYPRRSTSFLLPLSSFPLEHFDKFVHYIHQQINISNDDEKGKEILNHILRFDQYSLDHSLMMVNGNVKKKEEGIQLLSSLFTCSHQYWLLFNSSPKYDPKHNQNDDLNFFRSSFILPIQMRILCCIQKLHKNNHKDDHLIPALDLTSLLTDHPTDLSYLHFFST